MEINYEKLFLLLTEAYDLGYKGCNDLKNDNIENLLLSHNIKNEDEFKIFKVEELKQLPVGTILQHIIKGRCWVQSRVRGKLIKYIQFQNGGSAELIKDAHPWDKPMRIVHKPKS